MQYLTFLTALLLPALAAAQRNATSRANYTTTSATLPTYTTSLNAIYPNTTVVTSTHTSSFTPSSSTDGSQSTATSVVVVSGTSSTSAPASTTKASGNGVGELGRVGGSMGAFAIALGVVIAGHVL